MNHTVPCPGCGRMVDVPEGMDACFCTFCGARVSLPAVPEANAVPEASVPALDTAALARELASLAVRNRSLARQFGRTTYEPQFRAYQALLSPLVLRLEEALPQGPGREEALRTVAAAWLDALAARWKRGRPQYEDQHVMAVFTIPALRDLPQRSGDELARAAQAMWVERWPKEPIGLGSFDDIVNGFRRRLCYITGAVCRSQGQGDDCYELTAFRRFRDQVMLRSDEGRALVEEYYRLAPAIVTSVRLCRDEKAVYDQVYREYLLPCLRLLEAGDEKGCRDKYVEMVRHMEKTCLPQ